MWVQGHVCIVSARVHMCVHACVHVCVCRWMEDNGGQLRVLIVRHIQNFWFETRSVYGLERHHVRQAQWPGSLWESACLWHLTMTLCWGLQVHDIMPGFLHVF